MRVRTAKQQHLLDLHSAGSSLVYVTVYYEILLLRGQYVQGHVPTSLNILIPELTDATQNGSWTILLHYTCQSNDL